jgi:hypothetical protein
MRSLLFLSAAVLWLVFAAPAQAVTYSYCHSSLRGGGSLAPDPDVFQYANQIGADALYHESWTGGDGTWTVHEWVRFYRNDAPSVVKRFTCQGSGGNYNDWRST